ncbi:MAG: hypothetical protein SOT81_03455 [Treponema sp.]|nr:hypothetical protein [Treponema sp.]
MRCFETAAKFFSFAFAKTKLFERNRLINRIFERMSDSGTADSPTRAALCGSGNALMI